MFLELKRLKRIDNNKKINNNRHINTCHQKVKKVYLNIIRIFYQVMGPKQLVLSLKLTNIILISRLVFKKIAFKTHRIRS